MTLQDLAQSYIDRKADSGVFIDAAQALKCAVEAARYFNGWADFASAPGIAPGAISGTLALNADEVAILSPLTWLLCEREEVTMAERSQVMGVQTAGRSTSEIDQDILAARDAMRAQAYIEPGFTVGY